jgi:hypothetical protein
MTRNIVALLAAILALPSITLAVEAPPMQNPNLRPQQQLQPIKPGARPMVQPDAKKMCLPQGATGCTTQKVQVKDNNGAPYDCKQDVCNCINPFPPPSTEQKFGTLYDCIPTPPSVQSPGQMQTPSGR